MKQLKLHLVCLPKGAGPDLYQVDPTGMPAEHVWVIATILGQLRNLEMYRLRYPNSPTPEQIANCLDLLREVGAALGYEVCMPQALEPWSVQAGQRCRTVQRVLSRTAILPLKEHAPPKDRAKKRNKVAVREASVKA